MPDDALLPPMNRRGFLRMSCACMAGAGLLPGAARAQAWQSPMRFARPELSSDEGGLWALMDREEARLRRSPFALRDPSLQAYVQDLACRLAGEHCPDLRVHLVRTPMFNASMAPNGMMQVWTGLLLRMDNEAQLAAVLGHEIGHYLERHSLQQLQDAKSRSAVAQFLGLFGLVGAIGQIAALAGAFAYSREQERDADRIGVQLMRRAGYDPAEAARVWENLGLELQARPGGAADNPMFASHPAADERRQTLQQLAAQVPGGRSNDAAWRQRIAPFLFEWLEAEIKRGQHEESLALLERKAAGSPQAVWRYACGEVRRTRAQPGDLEAALADFAAAVRLGGEPPQTHRGMGMIHRAQQRTDEARASFARYLELAPAAPDAAMIRNYMTEIGT